MAIIRSAERLRAALRLNQKHRFYLLYGPGTLDHFISRDYAQLNALQAVWRLLREEAGFKRIIFLDSRGRLFFLDERSRQLSLPPSRGRPGEPTGGTGQRRLGRLGKFANGPLGDQKILPPTPERPAPALRPDNPTDIMTLLQLDAAMRDASCKTAVVIVQAEKALYFNQNQRTLSSILDEWEMLPPQNENCAVLLFTFKDIADLVAHYQNVQRTPLPGLLNRIGERRSGANAGSVALIGGPEEQEMAAIVQRARLLGRVDVNWAELPSLVRAMAAENQPAAYWIKGIGSVRKLNRETVKRKKWVKNMPSPRPAMQRLDEMTGLAPVKDFIQEMVDAFLTDEEDQAAGTEGVVPQMRHMAFFGNPGTGKTTVARLFGEICRDYGILRRGHLVTAEAKDLVGEYVGQTPPKANAVVDQAMDGVLFIDEAYQLTASDRGGFGREAVDALITRLVDDQSRLIVIVAGYTKPMREFMEANPGLPGRFPNVIEFPDYVPDELWDILQNMLKARQLTMISEMEQPLRKIVEGLYAARDEQFSNAREMETLANALRRKRQRRRRAEKLPATEPLRPGDIPDKYRSFLPPPVPNQDELQEELNQLVGLESVKDFVRKKLSRLRRERRRRRVTGARRAQSLHMVFVGNPGTGKTTVARLMGEAFRSLGILRKGHVVETSRSGLIAPYVGQTAGKTEAKIKEALDGVLFIDEAYSLAQGGQVDFGQEAITALVQGMENYRDRLVVIVAGYPEPMREFLESNEGMSSRFTTTVAFPPYTSDQLVEILRLMASAEGFSVSDAAAQEAAIYLEGVRAANPRSFGNGRAVRNLLNDMIDNQAVRLEALGEDVPAELEFRLEAEDVPGAGQEPFESMSARRAFDLVSSLPAVSSPPTTPEAAIPAVAYIEVQERSGQRGSGSGFLVTPDGYLVTAYHVIAKARDIHVYLGGGRQNSLPAQVVGADPDADLAVLHLPPGAYPYLPLVEQLYVPSLGEPVAALSFPLGSELGQEPSFEKGDVSSLRDHAGVLRVQFSATVTRGSSGGPVFRRSDLRVLGVVYGGARPDLVQGINLATSIEEIYRRFGSERAGT